MYNESLIFGVGFYEIFIAIALIGALFLSDRLGVRRGFSISLQRHFIVTIIVAVLVGFFGAILFQAVYHWIATGHFSLDSGMTFYGGLIFGVAAFLLFWFFGAKLFKVADEAKKRFADVADIAAAIIPLAHGLGRIGCLFAGCCHGKITDAWYGIVQHDLVIGETYYESAKVVPIQLFEALVLFALDGALLAVFFYHSKKSKKRFPLLPIYLAVYGVWRYFIEYARADERGKTIVPFWSPSQLIAVIMVLAGIVYFCLWLFWLRKRVNKE